MGSTEMMPLERDTVNQESTALYPEDDDDVLLTIEQALERMGSRRFQRRLQIAAGLCFAADPMEILLLSFLAVVLREEWGLTSREFSWIFGAIFAGAFLGTLTLGRLGDLYGRKPIFVVTASLIAVFGVLTAFVQTHHQLLVCRFFVGFGVGGITVPFETLAELTTTSTRGIRLVSTSFFWTMATLMVPIVAWSTLGTAQGNWRLFVALCALPSVVSAIVGLYAVPELPRWLLQQGDVKGALAFLRQAAILNGKDPAIVGTQLLAESKTEKATVCNLFSPKWFQTTLLLWCLWGSYAFLYYGMVIAVTLAFFKNKHGKDNEQQSYHFDYIPIILSSSAEVAGVTLVLFTVDRFGRIPCLSTYFFLGGLSVLRLYVLEPTSFSTLKTLAAFLARLLVYSGSNIVWILTAELLETQIRTTGHSASNAVARVGAFAAPFLVQPTEQPLVIGITMVLVS